MQYYISWTHSDPPYHHFIPGLGVLIGPPNVSLTWTVDRWPSLPQALIVDSGAYQYWKARKAIDPAAVLARQLRIRGEHTGTTGFCHADIPLLGTRELTTLDGRMVRTLENARWLMDMAQRGSVPAGVDPIGVIQGYSVERIYHAARRLQDMGYAAFALGSLAALATTNPDEVLRRIEAAVEAVGPEIHVLGVSTVSLLPEISRLGVRSADSSAPIREAWMGGVVYSRPFRRFKIATAHFREWQRNYKFAELLYEPLPCDCPVCHEDSSRLLIAQGKHYVNLRALHNCYHLSREFS